MSRRNIEIPSDRDDFGLRFLIGYSCERSQELRADVEGSCNVVIVLVFARLSYYTALQVHMNAKANHLTIMDFFTMISLDKLQNDFLT